MWKNGVTQETPGPFCKAGLKSTGDKVTKGLDYYKSCRYVVKSIKL